MSDLILVGYADNIEYRCGSLDEAKKRAASLAESGSGDIFVEVTPEGGGIVQVFSYDRVSGDLC
ncbi:hypothetical protein [Pannonibacter indicus]|uniref:hypothetical protein n=1 Tax=Pannonibacter indicus TaxID=466044 RepID=UPI0035B13C94